MPSASEVKKTSECIVSSWAVSTANKTPVNNKEAFLCYLFFFSSDKRYCATVLSAKKKWWINLFLYLLFKLLGFFFCFWFVYCFFMQLGMFVLLMWFFCEPNLSIKLEFYNTKIWNIVMLVLKKEIIIVVDWCIHVLFFLSNYSLLTLIFGEH